MLEKPSNPWLTPQLSVPRSLTAFRVCAPAGMAPRHDQGQQQDGREDGRSLRQIGHSVSPLFAATASQAGRMSG